MVQRAVRLRGARLVGAVVALAAAATGCDGRDDGETPGTQSSIMKPFGSNSRESQSQPPDVRLKTVATGFDQPLGIAHAGDGSRRLFVVEQGGRIRIFKRGRVLRRPFLDVSSLTRGGGERGLLGLAFHPNYSRNGRFFVNYTDLNGDTMVAEYRRSETSADRADPGSAEILLQVDQPFSNHNGGGLSFGPDGYLYIGMGDGGSAGDPQENGQRLDTLLGKMLRIDVDVSGEPYGIPPDNPFTDNPLARPEIWALGLRNPWRFSFDRAGGDLWIADVGQNRLEEIDASPSGSSGLNFGWDVMEGRSCFEPPTGCDSDGLRLPVAQYGRGEGCAVIGGYVYRGARIPSLAGRYVFGDLCTGTIWWIAANPRGTENPETLVESEHAFSSFGENEAGELYVTDLGSGELLRMAPQR